MQGWVKCTKLVIHEADLQSKYRLWVVLLYAYIRKNKLYKTGHELSNPSTGFMGCTIVSFRMDDRSPYCTVYRKISINPTI